MAITCNFEKDEHEIKRADKVIVRVAPGQAIGVDTPELKPVKSGYLWVVNHRRRQVKSWRELN